MILKKRMLYAAAIFLCVMTLLAEPEETPLRSIDDCINIALKNNPQLQSMQLTAHESEARVDEVRAGFYPSLSISSSASRYDYESAATGTGLTSRENYQAGIYARYPIFEGFRTVASHDAAKANFQANQAQYRQYRSDLIFDVTEAYYRLIQAERLVQVAEKSLKRAKMHLDYANARFENELASRSDVLKAKVEQSNAKLALIRARNNRLAASGRLNVLLGREAQRSIRIRDNLESGMSNFSMGLTAPHAETDSFAIQANTERLINLAFQSRPELVRMDRQLKAQQAAVRIARSDYFPTLSLDGNYTYSGETTSDLQGASYVGVSLNMPLFSGFSRPARSAQENYALKNLERQRENLKYLISMEVWNAYLSIKEAQERINNNQIFLENAKENLRIANGEYKEGVGSMIDLIDAETALVTAEESYIEALADFQIARAELNRATGANETDSLLQNN